MAVKCILTGQTPSVLDGVTSNVQTQLDAKQNKITAEGILQGDGTGGVTAADKAEVTLVSLDKTTVGLDNVDNTSDAAKPISTATQTALDAKQDKITVTASRALVSDANGKITVSDVTSTELGYLDGVTSNIQTQLNSKLSSAPVTSVAGKTGAVTLAKGDVGLGNVDNTSDANKPISTATQTALDGKQGKIAVDGILEGDGTGAVTAAEETDVELVSMPHVVNPNLLDNWYFGNPVNQRGQTTWSGLSAYGYGIDRWVYTPSTVCTLTINGVTLTADWQQYIEKTRCRNGSQCTMSVITGDG